MGRRDPDEKSPRHRAVLLSELIGQESMPLPVRKKPAEEENEAADSAETDDFPESDGGEGKVFHKTWKTSKKRGKTTETAKEKQRPTAFDAAMTILACGDNSERMLREKLTRKGYTPLEIGEAIRLLREKRYICDERLMERYASALARKKFYGARRIRAELFRKFDRAVVEAYFEDAIREIDFPEQARVYAEKNSRRGREYLIRRLSYLGYDGNQIRAAVKGINEEVE